MSFFVGKNGTDEVMDAISRPETYVDHDPSFADRFEATQELRSMDDGSLYAGAEFKRVATLSGPLSAMLNVLDESWLRNKKRFYRWLDRNPQYCTYDRRRSDRGGIFVNGIVVPETSIPKVGVSDGESVSQEAVSNGQSG